jgi:hypothetical protein
MNQLLLAVRAVSVPPRMFGYIADVNEMEALINGNAPGLFQC